MGSPGDDLSGLDHDHASCNRGSSHCGADGTLWRKIGSDRAMDCRCLDGLPKLTHHHLHGFAQPRLHPARPDLGDQCALNAYFH